QTDMTLGRARAVQLEVGDFLSVERHHDASARDLDVVTVPLADRLRSQRRGWRESIDRARLVQRVPRLVRVGVEPRVVDLDLVTVIHRKRPVAGRAAAVHRGESDEDAGVVSRTRRAPFEGQCKVGELLSRVPEQSEPAEGLQGVTEDIETARTG